MNWLNVLLFHEVCERTEILSAIRPEVFFRCIELVHKSDLIVRTVAEFDSSEESSGASMGLCLTFDDGWESDVKVALPELVRRGLRGTFFVITGEVGNQRFLSWSQVRELADAGMEIGSHTCSHRDLTHLSARDAYEELGASRRELEDRLGRLVTALSVPHGYYNRSVLALATEAGYDRVCVSRPGLNRIPIGPGVPLRRNALHQLVPVAGLPGIVRPHRSALLWWEAGYASRALAKGMLSRRQYERLRRTASRVLWATRNVLHGRSRD